MEDTRGWAIAQGMTGDDRPLLVRLKRYEPEFARSRYPHRLDIAWPASADAVDGLPTVGSSRVDLQACKLEYSIVSPK